MAIVFGDRETGMAAARSVNKVHARVTGHDYRALDPDLLLWVHATLVDTALVTYETFVRRLPAQDREDFYQQLRLLGEVLGIPSKRFPASVGDFDEYVRACVDDGEVRVGGTTLELSKLVVRPRLLPPPGAGVLPSRLV